MLGKTYKVNPKVESQWVAVGTLFGGAVGVAIGGTLTAMGLLDENTAAAVGTAVGSALGGFSAGIIRIAIGHFFLPNPEE